MFIIVHPTIRIGFDIVCVKLWSYFCKFGMLSIKFNYAAPFSLLKLVQSSFYPSASSFDPLATFLVVFCTFRCLTFLPFVRKTLLIKWNVKPDFCFATVFHCCSLYLTQCLAVFLIVEVFTLIIVMTKAVLYIWKFFSLVVSSCLYPSWSVFYPRLKWLSGLRSATYFVANIVKTLCLRKSKAILYL